ncbi:hydrogenase nickel incorporation protein HypB [Sulfuricurvum sp.]|uniref:hydrogenase nickel incorporation protein HypB n=1 Tax=Sulfuricurvum sp. TaxID=2025608 RepID=UPI00261ABAE7|nr:hydrogenase nickel incorporation protein HypB [Sulfuricurvum sp.]MDD2266098.1 hydrogenase nickel incorporation protein HypB [Sulfuricurvum sp.]MDD2782996.1 hydrogenase nickel incorporation protein HypB [Sulfuricurvum sp.]
MCKDCGCSITDHHHDDHDHEGHHHHHDHEGHHHDHSHDHSHTHQAAHETLHHNPQLNDTKTIAVIKKILDKNDQEAHHNREHFNEYGVLAINLMSSPGSGKTTLLEKMGSLAPFKFGVVEGDLETSRDADRLKAVGIPAVQIQTGSACHLDAFMVHKGLHDMPIADLDVCFIENVGNLVCPASYDVGSHLNIVLVSIPEGEDKIAKYPVMFRAADLILITKTDLLPYFKYDIEREKAEARKIKPNVDILEVNINDEDSVKRVIEWIEFKRKMRA